MASGTQRKYYILGGKCGVGKTSCAASCSQICNGHPILVVSTDPAHSLSDSFAQDLTGGTLVPVEGPYSPLFALEINLEKAKEEFRSARQRNGGSRVKDFVDGMGLGVLAEQIKFWGTRAQSFLIILSLKSLKFCWRRPKKATQKILLLH